MVVVHDCGPDGAGLLYLAVSYLRLKQHGCSMMDGSPRATLFLFVLVHQLQHPQQGQRRPVQPHYDSPRRKSRHDPVYQEAEKKMDFDGKKRMI